MHFNAFFFLPVRFNPLDSVLHIQNIAGKREHQCGDDVYLKTETKPFPQNAYLLHFLEGHLSSLHSRLTQESPKPCQMNASSTFKKTCNYYIKKLAC